MTLTDLETVAVATALAGVLAALSLRIRTRRRRVAALVLTLTFVATGAWTAMYLRVPPVAEEEITYRPIAVRTGGYVSSETCRACHPREYATWHGSYHRSMTQVATPEAVLGDFEEVTLDYHGRSHRLRRDGALFWFEWQEEGPEGRPATVRRPIVLTTGSHHLQAYWFATGDGRAVEFFPFIYLIPERRWVPRESVFLQPTVPANTPLRQLDELETWQKNRQWNHSCIHCHTTHGQPMFPRGGKRGEEDGARQVDTRVGEFGIACEACHGPAEDHVAANRDPGRRFSLHLGEKEDDTIVDPADLTPKLTSQVCGVCHGISYPKTEEEIDHDLSTGRRFRPGDELEATRVVCRSDLDPDVLARDCPTVQADQRFWSDGMLRVSGREYMGLLDSPCYRRGELTCLSCHLLHPQEDDPRPLAEWADDQLKPGMDGNLACLQCHDRYGDTAELTAHTRHAPESTGSQCYNCHMPFTSYGLLKAIRSHEIHDPSVSASLETGRPNGCNQCHLDKTLAWSAEHLANWYGQERPEMSEVERAVPASIVWLLSGDAGQRALMAWSLGWEPARQTSGTHWMAPMLAQLLADPYDAVRLIASRSLRRQPGFEDFDYDYLAPAPERYAATGRANRRWAGLKAPDGQVRDARALVDDPGGSLPENIFVDLLRQRDDRVVMLAE